MFVAWLPALALAVAAHPGPAADPAGPADHGRTAQDRRIEDLLANAEVVVREPIGKGVTHSERLVLRQGELGLRAIFKTIDERYAEPSRVERLEMNFADRYVYEVAAYRIDRLFGLGAVPPAVVRVIDGRRGSVQLWVEDAVELEELAARDAPLPAGRAFAESRAAITILDALIFNTDRNADSVLLVPAEGRLRAVDHSRSFRLDRALPAYITDWTLALPPAVVERLRSVTRAELHAAAGDVLTRAEIAAVDRRRQLVLRKLS